MWWRQRLQGPELLQGRRQLVQGPERLQGPGLDPGGQLAGMQPEGRQGSLAYAIGPWSECSAGARGNPRARSSSRNSVVWFCTAGNTLAAGSALQRAG